MDAIRGVTFAPFARAGVLGTEKARESLRIMAEDTGANFVIFVPGALQETAQSEEIDDTTHTMTDEELISMLRYAHSLGLRTAVKPTVNCKNGTWRAHINFFDEDVPCEPKWGNWFRSYTAFQLHYARIAKEEGCEMFIAGCEMVMSERREAEWRKLIADIREVYSGLVSYNTDKYQEHNVKWWDAVDVISSSGYYPAGTWEKELDRIEAVVRRYRKPFFFAETGCMSVLGSKLVPNDWGVKGAYDPEGQRAWYEEMLDACEKREFVKGTAIWSWTANLYERKDAERRLDYEIYAKPAAEAVKRHYRAGV